MATYLNEVAKSSEAWSSVNHTNGLVWAKLMSYSSWGKGLYCMNQWNTGNHYVWEEDDMGLDNYPEGTSVPVLPEGGIELPATPPDKEWADGSYMKDGKFYPSEQWYSENVGDTPPYQEGVIFSYPVGILPDGSSFVLSTGNYDHSIMTGTGGKFEPIDKTGWTQNGDSWEHEDGSILLSDGTSKLNGNLKFYNGAEFSKLNNAYYDFGFGAVYTNGAWEVNEGWSYDGMGAVEKTSIRGTDSNGDYILSPSGDKLYSDGSIVTGNSGLVDTDGNYSTGGNVVYDPMVDTSLISPTKPVYEDDNKIRFEDGTYYDKQNNEALKVDDNGNSYKVLYPENNWESDFEKVSTDKPLTHSNGNVTFPPSKGASSGGASSGGSGGSSPSISKPTTGKNPSLPPSEGTGEGETGTGDWAGLIREVRELKEVTIKTHDMTYGSLTPVEGSLGHYKKETLKVQNEVDSLEVEGKNRVGREKESYLDKHSKEVLGKYQATDGIEIEIRRGQYSDPALKFGREREEFLGKKLSNKKEIARGKYLSDNKENIKTMFDDLKQEGFEIVALPENMPQELKDIIEIFSNNLTIKNNSEVV